VNLPDDLVLAGTGTADAPRPDLIDVKARAIIRYADSAAWITAAAVAQAAVGAAARLGGAWDDVGMAVVSDQGPRDTMEQVEAATHAGFSCPLRYAAANPGSMAGVSCIAFGLHGPTLNLTMRPVDGIPIALLVGRGWLMRGIARAMVLAAFNAANGSLGSARAVLISRRDVIGSGDVFTAATAEWLGHTGD